MINKKNKEIYIGEAQNLIKRLRQHFKGNTNWEFYRYDKLPDSVNSNVRMNIERMIIRSFASLMKNKAEIDNFDISSYYLKNSKIDK